MLGARGRMGTEVCRAVDAAEDLELVAMVDLGDWLFNIADAAAEVVVDFTTPDTVMDHMHWCIDQGINIVVGTSGFTESRYDRIRQWLSHRPDLGVIVVPNFAIGAVLMMDFAARAAKHFDIGGDHRDAPPEQAGRSQRHRSAHRRDDCSGSR